jgi:CubicO group peptidase (beta-lactamase class C family)
LPLAPRHASFHPHASLFSRKPIRPVADTITTLKLVTAVCALQLVERGLITLDEPLSKLLPEYSPPMPLATLEPSSSSTSSNGDDKLVMATTSQPITLRHLLSHSSGLTYDTNPAIAAWRTTLPPSHPNHPSQPMAKTRNVLTEYHYPLAFPPGTPGMWHYGVSLDWAGKLIERLSGQTLGAYMAEHIFDPLGMTTTTFRPVGDPRFSDRLFTRSFRNTDGSLSIDPMTRWGHHADPVDDLGGSGLYSTAGDYVKVVASLMLDDGKLLKKESVDELFKPQLQWTEGLQERLARNDDARAAVFETEKDGETGYVRWNFSLAGLVVGNGVPGKFGEGTGLWSGLPNCYWVS